MSGIKRHIIEKQFVEFIVKGAGDAFNFRNELEEVCKNDLIPEIEKLFDSIAPGDKLIRIENLEIDAGIIATEKWKTEFINNVLHDISDKIEILKDNSAVNTDLSGSEINEKENNLGTILFFLENGSLPWYSGIKNNSELSGLIDDFINMGDEAHYKKLKELLRLNKRALDRLVSQFDEKDMNSLTEVLFPGKFNVSMSDLIKSVLNSMEMDDGKRKKIFYSNWFDTLLNLRVDQNDQLLLKKLAQGISRYLKVEEPPGLNDLFRSELSGHLKKLNYSDDDINRIDTDLSDKKISEANFNIQKTDRNSDPDNLSEWYVTNCGLVIIHPFLLTLFEKTGYVENRSWISKDHQQRAIVLCQYLITGKEEYPEFLLMFNKVLCGYDIFESLPSDIRLSEFEKNEASEMLESVTGHWSALKNTTIEGLRETFLKRSGKLSKLNDEWHLKVEEKTADILMNKLPWGISVIKFPWMDRMLKTEWLY
ncbi:MAG: hypothetical protein KDD00_00680 [Ignavibacteriae bacterium]|nr:hypothetical protein [Ignavibacteriota bacterium]